MKNPILEENDVVKAQIVQALEYKSLNAQVAGAKANQKAMADLQGKLAKADIKAQQSEKLLTGIQKSLSDAKLLTDGDKLDPRLAGARAVDLPERAAGGGPPFLLFKLRALW